MLVLKKISVCSPNYSCEFQESSSNKFCRKSPLLKVQKRPLDNRSLKKTNKNQCKITCRIELDRNLVHQEALSSLTLHWTDTVLFCDEGPRSRCYGRTAALRLIVQPLWWRWLVFVFVFPCNGAPMEWNWQGKPEIVREKPILMPLCWPQIPHGLSRDRTRASAVRGRRLTAWAMARPY
jgi:hypothetical protein